MTASLVALFSLLGAGLYSPARGYTSSSVAELSLISGSWIRIDGDSTVRKYSAQTQTVQVKGRTKAAREAGLLLPWLPETVNLTIPVKELKSGERALDRHLRECLREPEFPQIEIKFTSFDYGGEPRGAQAKAPGTITVAGVAQPLEVPLSLAVKQRAVRVSGYTS